jgi:WXXGXW repeat (2 copies)
MNYRRLLCTLALAAALPMAANAVVVVSVNIAPPPLPVYVQPPIPAPGYLWTPGYWRWDPLGADYFWVPGTWVAPPAVGLLWTPGYWGWGTGGYFWHAGYWGPHVGFYGGVNYGFGYVGTGYHGGYWQGGVFNYNRSVNNINVNVVHNTYNEHVVENNTRVSFNGGQGGVAARESAEERAARTEHHYAPTPVQHQHEQVAMRSPEQRAAFNHGAPTMAAMARPSQGHAEDMHPGHEDPHGHEEAGAPHGGAPHGEHHGGGNPHEH